MIKKCVNSFKKALFGIRFGKKIRIRGLSGTHFLPKLYAAAGGGITIGDNLMAERNSSVEAYSGGVIRLGNNVFLNSNVKIVARKSITIGDHVMIAPNVCIYDHDHDLHGSDVRNSYVADEIQIGNNVWIGANSVILRGTKLGDNSVVAAGSVVKENVEAGCLFYQKRENVIKPL